MHMQGEPRTMQADPRYDDVAAEVAAFLEERLAFAVDAGIAEERICLDPGIGFGKTVEHNLELVRRLDVLVALGRPVVDRLVPEELARAARRDPDATTGSVAASVAARSRPTSAARRCSASTTSARRSRRCGGARRSGEAGAPPASRSSATTACSRTRSATARCSC